MKQRQKTRQGNTNAVTHGASSEARIRPAARSQKRRPLRQIGFAAAALDGVGRALLDNWARAAAKVERLDRHFAERGVLDADGEPVPATKDLLRRPQLQPARPGASERALKARHHSPLPALEGEGRRLRLEAEQRLRAVK